MLPTLKPNDQVFVDRHAYRTVLPEVGDLVIALDPRDGDRRLVKRVTAVSKSDSPGDRYELSGDNPEQSTDSRHFGRVSFDRILGKVTSRLP